MQTISIPQNHILLINQKCTNENSFNTFRYATGHFTTAISATGKAAQFLESLRKNNTPSSSLHELTLKLEPHSPDINSLNTILRWPNLELFSSGGSAIPSLMSPWEAVASVRAGGMGGHLAQQVLRAQRNGGNAPTGPQPRHWT